MKYQYLLLLCMFMGFKYKKSTLKITDLQIPNVEKEYIAANNIDTMYSISSNPMLNFGDSDTFAYHVYDKNGNILYDYFSTLGGSTYTYEYDSLHSLNEHFFGPNYIKLHNIVHKFVEDSLLLYSYYITDYGDSSYFYKYQFDSTGRLIFSFFKNEEGNSITNYEYNAIGKLTKKVSNAISFKNFLELSKNEKERMIIQITDNYYYSNNIIDSAITYYTCYDTSFNYTHKKYFDSNGLKIKKVLRDSIITQLKHIKREN